MQTGDAEMKFIDAPCKDCSDRHELCHSACEKYACYKQMMIDIGKRRNEDDISYAVKMERILRYKQEKWRRER